MHTYSIILLFYCFTTPLFYYFITHSIIILYLNDLLIVSYSWLNNTYLIFNNVYYIIYIENKKERKVAYDFISITIIMIECIFLITVKKKKLLNNFVELIQVIKYRTIFYNTELEWISYKEDMIKLSKYFPHLTFILRGEGEERNDNWIGFFHQGINNICHSNIIYEEPTEEFAKKSKNRLFEYINWWSN